MFVLSRKERQTIRIGNNEVEITVLEIHGSTVRLGIKAPDDVPILRGELCLESDFEMESVGVVCLPR